VSRAAAELGGLRTGLFIPLRRNGLLLGHISASRTEVRPFTDKQIALLQNFAAQAVIAMESARLLTETREALDQQTATAEVLQVINSSPGDLTPVFDAMLEKAMRLCEAAFGFMMVYDGDRFRPGAQRGVPRALAEYFAAGPDRPGPGEAHTRVLAGEELIHSPDYREEEPYRRGAPLRRAVVDLGGARTALVIALRKDNLLLGTFTLYRQEVRPFTDKQIALLQNFAAQAVIAMENARLITETREALEQQTATAEVLQVINSSPGNLAPVYAAILEKAHNLCEIAVGTLQLYDGAKVRTVAQRGVTGRFAELLREPYELVPGHPASRLLGGERIVHIIDHGMNELAKQQPDNPRAQASAQQGLRTALWVPLRKDAELLGYISAFRQEMRAFSEQEIALLESFAAQAVIAMENARLLNELQDRTRDLQESLEYQTATSDVLKVISRSTFDLQPVLETLLHTAARLCQADMGHIRRRDGDAYPVAAVLAAEPAFDRFLRERGAITPDRTTVIGRAVLERRVVHVTDIATDPEYGHPESVTLGKVRTCLGVPLLREGEPVGAMTVARTRVEPFSERQIELVRTFADQAVIAIENTRLLTETREALEQQTATAEVLQVINSSPGDLAPVFGAMLERAMRLCAAAFGHMTVYDGARFRTVAHRGLPPRFAEYAVTVEDWAGAHRRLAAGENVVQLLDAKDDEAYQTLPSRKALVDLGGARTVLLVALRKEEALLGGFAIYRQEVRAFTDKQIALLQNFAAQAVIAIENARLLTETREALEQQTATAEVLQVINSSPGDLAPVFEAMLEKAMRLCEAGFGELDVYDGQNFRVVATLGVPTAFDEYRRNNPGPPRPGSFGGRFVAGEEVIHIVDLTRDELYLAGNRNRRAIVELGGARTVLVAPLRKDEAVLGFIVLYRQEIRRFAEQQVALLQNFAAQAVIAMENARLLGELRERTRDLEESLEYQTARRRIASHQPLDRRCPTGAGYGGRNGRPALRRRPRSDHDTQGRGLPFCGEFVQCSGARVLGRLAPANPCPRRRQHGRAGAARRQGRACPGHPRRPGLRAVRECGGRATHRPWSAAAARGGRARHY
jgi:GAF domain-containing protein